MKTTSLRFILYAVLASALVTFTLTGCSFDFNYFNKTSNDKKLNENITLKCVFIGGGDYEKLYEEIPTFEKSTGYKVNIVYKGNGFDTDKKIKMDFAANTADYDVMWDHTSYFSQYTPYLEPLDSYFSADDLQDFLPRLINACRKDGKLWLIPRHADISAMYYRTDLFNDPKEQAAFREKYKKELKVPETWDEFEEAAEFFSRGTTLYGTQFAGKEEALTGRFYELLFSLDGEFIDSNGRAVFNSEAGIKAVTLLRTLYAKNAMPKGMVNYLWDDLSKNWTNGNIAIYTEWYGTYTDFQNPKSSKVAGKFDIARQPAGPGGIHGGWGGVHAFSIPKTATHKEEAAKLIKFLTNPDNSYKEAKIGYLTVRNSVWERLIKEAATSKDPLAVKRLNLAKLQLAEDFRTPPLIAEWIPASNILFPKLQSIILGEKDAKTTLDEAAAEINKLLDDSIDK